MKDQAFISVNARCERVRELSTKTGLSEIWIRDSGHMKDVRNGDVN